MALKPIEGEIFVIDKPLGWSSFHVVKKLRGALSARLRKVGMRNIKIGHAGTLDPLATGVMIICTGKATKRIEQLQEGVKEYIATIRLGATTPSFDLETPVDATYPTEHITRELVENALAGFRGRIEQIPPTYSACKIAGDRAYKMARRGEEVKLKPKILVIDELELLEYTQQKITVRVVCSKGTYIRALARDIGAALGSGGHLSSLRRTRVGEFGVADALAVADAVRKVSESAMEIENSEGDMMSVPAGNFREMLILREDADIKPFSER